MLKHCSLALALLCLAGCSNGGKVSAPSTPSEEQASITGHPMSVYGSPPMNGGLAIVTIVLYTKENKRVVCSTFYTGKEDGKQQTPLAHTIAVATSLVQSEIEDGDAQTITVHGEYNTDGTYLLKKVEVEGYTISFGKE